MERSQNNDIYNLTSADEGAGAPPPSKHKFCYNYFYSGSDKFITSRGGRCPGGWLLPLKNLIFRPLGYGA